MAMSSNSIAILDYLKGVNGADVTLDDIAAATGLTKKQVNGSFVSFQKKGHGYREEAEIVDAEGVTQKVKFLKLTDAGIAFDPNAEVVAE